MDRWTVLGALASGAMLASVGARAQTSRRIGYLSQPTRESVERALHAFLQTLRELGWIEGQNLVSSIAGPTAKWSGCPPSLPTSCSARSI